MEYQELSIEVDNLARAIVDAAYKVHRNLGPGLLESVYERCLMYELDKKKICFERQKKVPVLYDGVRLDTELRLDMLVEDEVVVELKAVEMLLPIHDAQLLTYLKLTEKRLGLLINFNVPLIKNGIKRRIL